MRLVGWEFPHEMAGGAHRVRVKRWDRLIRVVKRLLVFICLTFNSVFKTEYTLGSRPRWVVPVLGSRNRQVGARADPSIGRRPAGKSASFARWAPPFTRATKPTRALPAAVASTSRSGGSIFNGSQREPMQTAFLCCIHFSTGELAIRLPLVTHPYPSTPALHL